MKTRIIKTAMHFQDEWFYTLPIGYRYLFIYLFTNEHIGMTGAYKISERILLLETGATKEEWDLALEMFEKAGKIKYIEGYIIVINAKKHSDYSGGKNETAYKNEFDQLPVAVQDTLSIHYPSSIDTTINKKPELINQKPETREGGDSPAKASAREIAEILSGKKIKTID